MATLVGMRIGTLRATVVGAVVIALSGCIGGDPLPTLPPTPTATPIFASEEEALAAAEEAYAAYLEVSSLIANEGGVDPERIAPFVTEERLVVELRGFAVAQESGLRILGASSFEAIELQRFEPGPPALVAFYACWDASTTRVVDINGADVTPTDRVERAVLEVVLTTAADSDHLVLESDEQWPDLDC